MTDDIMQSAKLISKLAQYRSEYVKLAQYRSEYVSYDGCWLCTSPPNGTHASWCFAEEFDALPKSFVRRALKLVSASRNIEE